ncbi:MAG: PHP domain-containing protein [Candidatus Dormibacteraceae bacterium]
MISLGRADLHTHTRFSDGRDGPVEMLARAARLRLDVLAITDHNTIEGALIAAGQAATGPGHPAVVVGEEISSSSGHILGLFLRQHVERGMTPADTVAAIHAQGGLAVAVHPCWRCADTPRGGGLGPDALAELQLDAIEVVNGGPVPSMWRANRRARAANEALGLAPVGGSDAHAAAAIGWAHTVFPGRDTDALRAAIERRLTEPRRLTPNPAALVGYGIWALAHDSRLIEDLLPV